jgi:hypothetical protein
MSSAWLISVAPIDLSTFSGGKVECQESRRTVGANLTREQTQDRITAGVALGAQTLEQLRDRVGMLVEQMHNASPEGIELAGAFGRRLPGLEALAMDPTAYRFAPQLEFARDLTDRQTAFIPQQADLAESVIVDHAAPPCNAWRRISATDCVWLVRSEWSAGFASAAGGRASNW